MTIGKILINGNYARARIFNPAVFQKNSLRTIDVGKRGGLKLIIGRPKGQTTTATQAMIIEKKDYQKNPRKWQAYVKAHLRRGTSGVASHLRRL